MTPTQINRSYDKAHDQARAGNLPTLTATELLADAIHEVWQVRSRTDGTTVYAVSLLHARDGITTLCDCPAGVAGRCCWHRGAARLAHEDAIAFRNEAGYRFRAKAVVPTPIRRLPTVADLTHINLSGRR